MNATQSRLPVLVAGGGIGGLAAALALTRRGFSVKVLEQAPQRRTACLGWGRASCRYWFGPSPCSRQEAPPLLPKLIS